jgi:gamma-glutamylcyclotransferase (GGCT)/AIG2-like uncharacterized protein YtfP
MFVYGSLMRGLDLHSYMAGATFVGVGRTKGTLVALGRYPGFIDGAGDVVGEIYHLEDGAQLEALDDLEEYDPANPQQSEYIRTERDVQRDDGSTIRAWVYQYNRSIQGLPVVPTGDWRHFVSKR